MRFVDFVQRGVGSGERGGQFADTSAMPSSDFRMLYGDIARLRRIGLEVDQSECLVVAPGKTLINTSL